MTISSIPKLFQPIRVGTANLQHRVVMAPMARFRADAQHVHGPLALEYHKQRTSVPGTLAITEGTIIAARAGGHRNVPGIWSDEQISGWLKVRRSVTSVPSTVKFLLTYHFPSLSLFTHFPPPLWQIVDAVHKNGSFIFLQLQALGRTASPDVLHEEGGYPLVAPSPIPIPLPPTKSKNNALSHPSSSLPVPRALTVEEIEEYVQLYATAARNAVLGAGFDGVEIHAANGYLPDQFLQSNSNQRSDFYGGSVQNRLRFVLEVTEAITKSVGANRVGIRLSPWTTYQGEYV